MFEDLIPSTPAQAPAPPPGMFDDLIPAGGAIGGAAGGMFDDLIPSPDAASEGAAIGVLRRGWEGAKQGFGSEPVGFSAENRRKYPLSYLNWQPIVAPIDTALRLPGAVAGGLAGLGSGIYRTLGGGDAESDRLERDLNILGQGALIESGMNPAHVRTGADSATRSDAYEARGGGGSMGSPSDLPGPTRSSSPPGDENARSPPADNKFEIAPAPASPSQQQIADNRARVAEFLTRVGIAPDRIGSVEIDAVARRMGILPQPDAIETAALRNALEGGVVSPDEVDWTYGPGAADAVQATSTPANGPVDPAQSGALGQSAPDAAQGQPVPRPGEGGGETDTTGPAHSGDAATPSGEGRGYQSGGAPARPAGEAGRSGESAPTPAHGSAAPAGSAETIRPDGLDSSSAPPSDSSSGVPPPNARGSTGPPPDQPRVSENGAPSGAFFISGDREPSLAHIPPTAPLVPEQIPRQAADSQGRIADFLTDLGVPPDRVDPDVIRSAAEAMAVEPLAPAEAIEAAALADAIGRDVVTPAEAGHILGPEAANAIDAAAGDRAAAQLVKLPTYRLVGRPKKRGDPPIGDDGYSVERHHHGQVEGGLMIEMTRTDHRLGDNYKKNHPNTGQEPSKIDRPRSRREAYRDWAKAWDEGLKDLPLLSKAQLKKLQRAASLRRQSLKRRPSN